MHTCTDACTHSDQTMEPEGGTDSDTHSVMQGHLCFHVSFQKEGIIHGESAGHAYMY